MIYVEYHGCGLLWLETVEIVGKARIYRGYWSCPARMK